MSNISIKVASVNDAKRLLEIYTPYVLNTAITFEYDVPSLEEFQSRIKNTLIKYPYLVLMENEKIIGYGYTGAFHPRAAYQWAAETSIYLDIHHKGKGLGHLLYQELERISHLQHITNLNACITYGNPQSIHFHEKEGYQEVAHFHRCGYKFNQWYDMIWMEKLIDQPDQPLPFIPFSKLK